jgi:hypothetical protein
MQREETIDEETLRRVLNAVYQGNPVVSEAYSHFDEDVLSFPSLGELDAYISRERAAGRPWINLVIHYPETRGLVVKKKIDLIPEKCDGATFRYSMEGWGLIQLQIDYKLAPSIECRFAVNTEKRALAWAQTLSALGAPDQWEWKAVEKQVRRLIRVLRHAS